MGMTITEGIKQLKIIQKRMLANQQDINKYASKLNSEKAIFETEEEQKKQVQSLIQANEDLLVRYLDLKKNIEYTNLMIQVDLGGKKYFLSDLIVLKRKLGELIVGTYNQLNTNAASSKMLINRGSNTMVDGKPIQVEMMYNEKAKNEKLREWKDLLDAIDGKLETINATTDLMELTK